MTQEFFAFFFSFSIFISVLVSVSDLPPSQMSPRLQITIFNSITEEFIVHSFSGEHKLYSHVDFLCVFQYDSWLSVLLFKTSGFIRNLDI